MLFFTITRLASPFILLLLLGQTLAQSGHVQQAWREGPPSHAVMNNVLLYWTSTKDFIRIDLTYGLESSVGIFVYRERPFQQQESVCVDKRNARLITFGLKMSSFIQRGKFTIDVWPFGYQGLATQVTFNPSDFSCYENNEEANDVVAQCKWNAPDGRDHQIISF